MKHQLFFLILLFCCLPSWAQKKQSSSPVNVSGLVKGPDGEGIAKVSIREIDSNRRFFNQTTSDKNGLFSFRVRDTQHYLQFYAPGYRTLTYKMLGETSFRVKMERRRTSPYAAKAKLIQKSNRLFNGHYLGEVVLQQAWIEKMCDTLYAFILPIQMDRLVDEYPAGRQLIIMDELDRQIMQLENVVDAYPIYGDPDDVEDARIDQTYNSIAQSYTGTDRIPGGTLGDEKLYAYPHFQISRAQMEQLCNHPELLGRIVVDTYRANNYWNFFPTDKTISLLRKALEK